MNAHSSLNITASCYEALRVWIKRLSQDFLSAIIPGFLRSFSLLDAIW